MKLGNRIYWKMEKLLVVEVEKKTDQNAQEKKKIEVNPRAEEKIRKVVMLSIH